MRHLEPFATLADKYLVAGLDGPLVHAKDTHPADIRIDIDLHDMTDEMIVGIRCNLHGLRRFALALHEHRRVRLVRIRHQGRNNLQQLVEPGTGQCRNETHGNQVPATQRTLKWVMQLIRIEILPLLQVKLHQRIVEFDNLIN